MNEDHRSQGGLPEHVADPKFVERLEWQIRSEIRREREFARRSRSRGWMRAAATVVLSLALGFATATAAQQLGDRHEARYLRMQAEGQLELAEMRVRLVTELMAEQGADWDADDLRRYQWELEMVRFDRDEQAAQLEEILASGGERRGELTAPRVGGRDFVGERLEREIRRIDSQLAMMTEEFARQQGEDNAAAFMAEIEQLQVQRLRSSQELDLRRDFLAGRVSGEELLRQQRAEKAQERLRSARLRVDQIMRWQAEVQDRIARGDADRMEARAAEYELAAARLDLRLARFELRSAGGSDPGAE